jgi:adenosylcobinamide-GDP ribazoletransferase
VLEGLRLALTTFTVLPVASGRVDRSAARVAMILAPAVGAALGLVIGLVAFVLRLLHAPTLVLGGVAVALAAALTRGLHLDGLADTADGLGSYTPPSRTLSIMRSPEVGPFGVVAIVLAMLLQAGAFAGMAGRPVLALLAASVVGLATGRLGVTWACRRGQAAARPDGLGALVVGTTRPLDLALGYLGVALVGLLAVPGRPWQGPVAALAGLGATVLLHRHAVRRLGGTTGDVLGAIVEVGQTVALVGLSFG